MAYTTIDDPSAYFQTVLYTGNEQARNITFDGNSDMQPDWVWAKIRTQTYSHRLFDSVRGTGKFLHSDGNDAEGTQNANVSAFNSDGFSLGNDNGINSDGDTHVAWNWKAGTSFTNDASSTSVGTIDSAGSVSTASGFSIVSYTGTGTAGTIAHGLGKLPKMIIAKNLSDAENWVVYFLDTTIANNNVQNYLELNTTIAFTADSGARWGAYGNYSTTTFGVGTDDGTNKSGSDYVAYVFSDIQAYSKIGKYIGNGNADGTFIYTGFKPAWVMIKATNQTGEGWFIFDNVRDVDNFVDKHLIANTNVVEGSGSHAMDFVSNGIKIRNAGDGTNTSAKNYIYLAFAENPFVSSSGVPATAR